MITRNPVGFRHRSLAAGLAILSLAGSLLAAPPARTARPEEGYPKDFIIEGPLPDGYPKPSEVGKIVEKSYPLSRTFSAEGNRAFSRCFVYLVLHRHEMTAPVIMDYKHRDPSKGGGSRGEMDFVDVKRMHFVLGNPELDQPKKEGFVEVADLPRLRVLSVAFQGQLNDEILRGLEAKLADELKRRPELVADGPPRVLGYNSPMIPKDKNYWEIQIPLKAASPAKGPLPKS